MDRVYSSGASGSAPATPASPSSGYPTSGNPATATPATKPGAFWYHMIMEELMAVITAAGVTPDKSSLTQLLTALRSAGVFQTQATNDSSTKAATTAFANPGASLSTNGYQKLPSGLIIQWGRASVATNGSAITLPVAYPNAHLRTFTQYGDCSAVGTAEPMLGPSIVGQRTLTNFVGKYQTSTGVNSPTSILDWFSIGN